ncbi:hypothetical protein FOA52_014779 [Chlamydomonas sp. UWO 241]|nr:hypothetical protein FOA52_014779 [Chlamydomonas sp. UWO 241]
MPAPRFAALALLVLLAPALVAARSLTGAASSGQKSAIEQMQEDCLSDDEIIDIQNDTSSTFYGLDNADCKACMADTYTLEMDVWPCREDICQNYKFFAEAYPAAPSSPTAFNCAVCVADNDPNVCQLCVSLVPSAYSELNKTTPSTDVLDARAWCVAAATYKVKVNDTNDAVVSAGTGTAPAFADVNAEENKFTAAVTVCANIPDSYTATFGDVSGAFWKDWCLKCLWSPTAQPKPAGTLEYADWAAMAAENETRPTDYGACAFQANQSFYIEAALIKPVGIRETCAWEKTDVLDEFMPPVVEQTIGDNNPPNVTSGFVVSECVTCMDATYQYADARIPGVLGTQPINTSKAYACALCRHPNWMKAATEDEAILLAKQCFACVADPNVYNAWGCNFCYEAVFLATKEGRSPPASATENCTTCVMSNPYEDKVGTYGWACAECASIADDDIRALCMTCVMAPSLMTAEFVNDTLAASLLDKDWVGMASELICSCIDMAKASTWEEGSVAAWYVASCPECTAMQKTCYKRRNITWAAIPNHGGVAEDPRVPFVKVVNAELPSNYTLLACNAALTEDEKMYLVTVLNGSICTTDAGSVKPDGIFDCRAMLDAADAACSIAVPDGAFPGYMLVHLDETIQVNGTGDGCVKCMSKLNNVTGTKDFAYACEQYCMNTYTITNLAEHDQCNTCISDGAALDTDPAVSPCEMCIQSVSWNVFPNATDRFARRAECMTCVNNVNVQIDKNKNWACGECAKMTSEAAGTACFACLAKNSVDPCACVDGVKRGWLFFAPASSACLDSTTITTSLTNGTLKGSITNGSYAPEQCAKIADGLGHPTFGLDEVGSCYTFPANIQYITGLPGLDPNCKVGAVNNCLCTFTPGAPDVPVGVGAPTPECSTDLALNGLTNGTCADIQGGGWVLVRHVPVSTILSGGWHPVNDNLEGTATAYGIPSNSVAAPAWGVKWNFGTFDEYLFVTGDCNHSLIATPAQVGTSYRDAYNNTVNAVTYTATARNVIFTTGSINNPKWLKRSNHDEDPYISLGNHEADCKPNATNIKLDACMAEGMLYAETSSTTGLYHRYLMKDAGGANVYIRKTECASKTAVESGVAGGE